MTITREQVADLQPGDVVRLVRLRKQDRYTYEGPVRDDGGTALSFDDWWLRDGHGNAPEWCESLTVISRAPRPLYVNHPRMNPLPGDVVRMENDGGRVVMLTEADGWLDRHGHEHDPKRKDGLRLLVDGETGQVVP